MTKWKPTPEGERIRARKMVGDRWLDCDWFEVRAGDIFRAVSPDGELIDPTTLEPNDQMICLATGDAIKNDPLGSTGQWYGYGVPCELFDSLDDLRKKGSN